MIYMRKILLVEPVKSRQSKISQELKASAKQTEFYVDIADNHGYASTLESNFGPYDFYIISDKFPKTSGEPLYTRVFMLAQDIHDRGVDYEKMAVISDSPETLEMARLLGIPNTYRKTQIPNPSPIERDIAYLADDITRILTGGQTTSSTSK